MGCSCSGPGTTGALSTGCCSMFSGKPGANPEEKGDVPHVNVPEYVMLGPYEVECWSPLIQATSHLRRLPTMHGAPMVCPASSPLSVLKHFIWACWYWSWCPGNLSVPVSHVPSLQAPGVERMACMAPRPAWRNARVPQNITVITSSTL